MIRHIEVLCCINNIFFILTVNSLMTWNFLFHFLSAICWVLEPHCIIALAKAVILNVRCVHEPVNRTSLNRKLWIKLFRRRIHFTLFSHTPSASIHEKIIDINVGVLVLRAIKQYLLFNTCEVQGWGLTFQKCVFLLLNGID
jgi:hypothetical protein